MWRLGSQLSPLPLVHPLVSLLQPSSPCPGLIAVSLEELDPADPDSLDEEEAAVPAPTNPLDTKVCPDYGRCPRSYKAKGNMRKHEKVHPPACDPDPPSPCPAPLGMSLQHLLMVPIPPQGGQITSCLRGY